MSSARLSWNNSTIDVLPPTSTSDTNAYIRLEPTTPAINVGENVVINGSENKISLNNNVFIDGNNTKIDVGDNVIIDGSEKKISLNNEIIIDGDHPKIDVGHYITIDGSEADNITLQHPSDSNKRIEINANAGTLTARIGATSYAQIAAGTNGDNAYISVNHVNGSARLGQGSIQIRNSNTETDAYINRIDDDYLRNPTEDDAKNAVPSTYAVYRAIQESISSDYYPFELIPNIDDPSKPTFTIRFNNIFGDAFKANTLSQDFVITYGADRYTNFVDNEGQIVRTTITMSDWKSEVIEKMHNGQTSFEYKFVDFTDADTTALEYESGSDYSFKFIGCTFTANALNYMFGQNGFDYEPDELSVKFVGCIFAENTNAEYMFGNLGYTKRLSVTGLNWSKIANAEYMFANLGIMNTSSPCQLTLDGDMNMSSIVSTAAIKDMFVNMNVEELDLSTLHFENITDSSDRSGLLIGNLLPDNDGNQIADVDHRMIVKLNNTYWPQSWSEPSEDSKGSVNQRFDISPTQDFNYNIYTMYIIEAVELNDDIATLTLRQGYTDGYDTGISNYELGFANFGHEYIEENTSYQANVLIKGLAITIAEPSIKIKSIKIKYYASSSATTQTEETFSGDNEFMTDAELAAIETNISAYIHRDADVSQNKNIAIIATTGTESYPFDDLQTRPFVYCTMY